MAKKKQPRSKAREIKPDDLAFEGLTSLFTRLGQLQQAQMQLDAHITKLCNDLALVKGEKPAKSYTLDIKRKVLKLLDS